MFLKERKPFLRPSVQQAVLHHDRDDVIARGPLAKGILTEKPLSDANAAIKKNGYLSYSYDELVKTKADIEKTAPDLSATETAMKRRLHLTEVFLSESLLPKVLLQSR